MGKKQIAAVKPARKTKPQITIEIDKGGPYVHVTIPEYESWIELRMNDKYVGVYQLHAGKVSIQLSGGLPNEYRFEVKILKKALYNLKITAK